MFSLSVAAEGDDTAYTEHISIATTKYMSEGFHLCAHSPASLNGKSIFSFAEFDQEKGPTYSVHRGYLKQIDQ